MCGNPNVKRVKPEQSLSELMHRELDVDIDPVALKLFIRAYWSRVSAYAHSIHENGQEPAADQAASPTKAA